MARQVFLAAGRREIGWVSAPKVAAKRNVLVKHLKSLSDAEIDRRIVAAISNIHADIDLVYF